MELLEGEDLKQRLVRGPVAADEMLTVGSQICSALQAAHEQGIIHREFKVVVTLVVVEAESNRVLWQKPVNLDAKDTATPKSATPCGQNCCKLYRNEGFTLARRMFKTRNLSTRRSAKNA